MTLYIMFFNFQIHFSITELIARGFPKWYFVCLVWSCQFWGSVSQHIDIQLIPSVWIIVRFKCVVLSVITSLKLFHKSIIIHTKSLIPFWTRSWKGVNKYTIQNFQSITSFLKCVVGSAVLWSREFVCVGIRESDDLPKQEKNQHWTVYQ